MLRSVDEITGYTLAATDGEVGRCWDFLFDEPWIVRYLVFDTGSWLSGRKVLVAPDWVRRIDWPQQSLSVDMTQEQVENSPVFDPSQPVNRDYEARLYDFYGRPRYWSR